MILLVLPLPLGVPLLLLEPLEPALGLRALPIEQIPGRFLLRGPALRLRAGAIVIGHLEEPVLDWRRGGVWPQVEGVPMRTGSFHAALASFPALPARLARRGRQAGAARPWSQAKRVRL